MQLSSLFGSVTKFKPYAKWFLVGFLGIGLFALGRYTVKPEIQIIEKEKKVEIQKEVVVQNSIVDIKSLMDKLEELNKKTDKNRSRVIVTYPDGKKVEKEVESSSTEVSKNTSTKTQETAIVKDEIKLWKETSVVVEKEVVKLVDKNKLHLNLGVGYALPALWGNQGYNPLPYGLVIQGEILKSYGNIDIGAWGSSKLEIGIKGGFNY
jgi:hypothetical protein